MSFKKLTIFSQKCICVMMQKRRRRNVHAFNKELFKSFKVCTFTSSLYSTSLLHFLCYILFIILIFCLSFLLSFLCKFVLFLTKFVLSFVRAPFISSILRSPYVCVFVSILCEYTHFSLSEFKIINYYFIMGDFISFCIFF